MTTQRKDMVTTEQFRWKEELPEGIKQDLSDEVLEQYHYWDETSKRLVGLHTKLMIPLINECFNKNYPMDTPIKLLSTEYSSERPVSGGKVLRSLFADLLLELAGKDLYHVEWQIKESAEIVLRMMEYDFHIGLKYGTSPAGSTGAESGEFVLSMPRSVIVYLDKVSHSPNELNCRVCIANKSIGSYKVPVMKVQEYSPEELEEKHLNILIPFLPLRFKHVADWKPGPKKEAALRQLTELYRKCIMILEREERNGTLIGMERMDLEDALNNSCNRVFHYEPSAIHVIMGPKFDPNVKLKSELYQEMVEETERMKGEINKYQEESAKYQEESCLKLINLFRSEGKTREETKKVLQDILFLSEGQAEEKLEQSWNETEKRC